MRAREALKSKGLLNSRINVRREISTTKNLEAKTPLIKGKLNFIILVLLVVNHFSDF